MQALLLESHNWNVGQLCKMQMYSYCLLYCREANFNISTATEPSNAKTTKACWITWREGRYGRKSHSNEPPWKVSFILGIQVSMIALVGFCSLKPMNRLFWQKKTNNRKKLQKGDKFLKKLWCCVTEGVFQENLGSIDWIYNENKPPWRVSKLTLRALALRH